MLLWFLPAIITLGFVTLYTDIRHGVIRNIHLLFSLVYCVIVYVILFFLNPGYSWLSYFTALLITCIVSLVFGFALWHYNFWTPGDAKLFFAFSALVPLSVYKYWHITFFDSLNILINTFVPVFFYFSALFLFTIPFKEKLSFLKKSFEPKTIFRVALSLFALYWLVQLLVAELGLPFNYFSAMLLLFLLIILFERLFSRWVFSVIIALSVLRVVFDRSVFTLGFLKEFFVLLALFVFLRFLVLRISFYFLTREVDVSLLKEGMIPAEFVYSENGRYRKGESIFFSVFDVVLSRFRKRAYLVSPWEALTAEQVASLKKLVPKLGFEHIRVHKTLPFAPFLFSGVLLTLAVQGNVFVFVKSLF